MAAIEDAPAPPDGVSVASEPGLSPTDFASAVTAITAAFGDPTRRNIYLLAHERPEGLTASETADRCNLHPNVARHHLDKLVGGGYLEITTERPNGEAGRPSKRYRTLRSDISLDVAVRHDDLLVRLLCRALAELGEERAAALSETVGEEYGREMADAMGAGSQRSLRTALHTVADALAAHGFGARAEDGADPGGASLRLITEHCPYGDAASEHPVLCAVDRGMVTGMLGSLAAHTEVSLRTSPRDRHDRCVASFDPA